METVYLNLFPTTCRFTFATASADNVKKWKYPNGDFMLNFDPHNTVVNAMAVNSEGVCVTGGVLWLRIREEGEWFP